ncbi:MAG TPA: VIT1/CCC1 transporter family protein [Candidatus Paceibacterota bacterium]|jgi:VIT1/CCC1 family predicted Fe2+/Mn2+ transporter
MTAEQFAENEYRDYVVYRELARVETIPSFKKILEELVLHEKADFEFWRDLADKREYRVGPLSLLGYRLMRQVLGLTFTAQFLEGREKEAQAAYLTYLETVTDPKIRERIENIVEHEKYHEHALIKHIEERRVKFVSSIILGINDGLIELTGALTGFALALQNTAFVALAGAITGVSASMSMAASAYLQARHEENGKNPVTAALFTGFSYLGVVILLVGPFLIFSDVFVALAATLLMVLLIIATVSLYSSVLMERPYGAQFGEMFLFSAVVAFIAFILGLVLRAIIGVDV